MDLNELRTRKEKIDVYLAEQGWDVTDRASVILEVDTRQSDFLAYSYKTVAETLKNDLESKYVDYLLLDSLGAPLAIIEAKRTSKDPLIGQKQAEQYADDIKWQTGKDVFIFLSNGYEIWFWDRERYPLRQLKGFYAQKDLERLRFQNARIDPERLIEVNTRIVDRPKSIENVKRVLEHLYKGHRKALIVMATGTGKTRVAMAIIDALLRENRAQRVLFLTDRKALRDQAWNKGFLEFFPHEAKDKILHGRFNQEKRLYVSTIQTFQEIYTQKDGHGQYLISPGEFDLIISDEAHRSIYNKWRDVFTYLDAVQIGLTATPAELVDRDTFRFFQCDGAMPTALYSYDEAVRDGVLVDFRKSILGAQTHFQIEGIRPSDLTESERDRLIEQGIDPDDIDFEGTELEKKVAVKGTSEAIVREFMENGLMDQAGTLPAKSIFFAISKKHARRLHEAFDDLYPEYKGRLARIIVSDDPRADALIHDFEHESFPRVAISVDMLDTGIDVPEVCNLVFAKPVFSKIKFWQMLGRGTRSDSACKHREWLPDGHKEYFKVFDFWNNFEYWNMNPEGVKNEPTEAITSRIFLLRLKQLERLREQDDEERLGLVRQRIEEDIRALPMDSVSVREHEQEIAKALSPNLWDNVGVDPLEYLKSTIMPLMRFQTGVNLNVASFTLKAERLGLAVLEGNEKEIERLAPEIGGMVDHLPRTLNVVREKEEQLDEVLSRAFWKGLSFEGAAGLIEDVAPLMRYMSKEAYEPIVIDMGDIIKERTFWTLAEEAPEYEVAFRETVERRVTDLADHSPAIQKILRDEPISEEDLRGLEEALSEAGVNVTDEMLQASPRHPHGTLIEFIRSLFGLYEAPDPRKKIEEAFRTYMIENNKRYSADQLHFIRTIQTVFMRKKHIVMDDLFLAPFTNFGSTAPVPMFDEDDLVAFIGICQGLERELFAVEA
ncbi:type I restriction enzyme EcoKI subunit R [Methanoculleus bourgensis MS2]|uniref:Type I restriction enzyme EcoKI subunit R n=1 Tax=Methanoculleus bourgensis (strain ATCC 43281 / DSM 3045 / OCM 15 / MS2) TaxID=1201294 RepID=I7J8D8_METBM|nr:DEAD/DEAH box helicase family protein [Methanoculleus bourgensis]CCJ36023.1 type I restriction enzyme EcoKI subunit R [Methanoculleus bourgensis MS2]